MLPRRVGRKVVFLLWELMQGPIAPDKGGPFSGGGGVVLQLRIEPFEGVEDVAATGFLPMQ
jgi:hypothetical protein